MRTRKLTKLKYNIWFYLVIFALLIVVVVWIAQILLFDLFYQRNKKESLQHTGIEMQELMTTNNEVTDFVVATWLDFAIDANEAGMHTYVAQYLPNGELKFETVAAKYSKFNGSSVPLSVVIGENNSDEVTLLDKYSDNSDTWTKNIITKAIIQLENTTDSYVLSKENTDVNEGCFYYIGKISNFTIDGYVVLISPLWALADTINIIQNLLIIETLVVVVLSFFVALYISNKLSKPIFRMSKTAKAWAEGAENATFNASEFEELRELAGALNYAKDAIAQTGILQRDLLANVSHDLKTPLTMIKAYAEMIRDLSGDIKEKRDLHTNVIIDEADRLAMLVNDILDLSKLQNGMNSPDIQLHNLSDILDAVLFRMGEFAANNGFTIITDIEDDLYTMCDSKEIEQVLYNLIGNSINYTGLDKTICVKLKRNGGVILFETIDTGKGISEEKLPTIWDKYYRFSESHQRPIKGTGLGLSIVKTILEGHNLKFGVISEKDVGSNFFVEFVAYDE